MPLAALSPPDGAAFANAALASDDRRQYAAQARDQGQARAVGRGARAVDRGAVDEEQGWGREGDTRLLMAELGALGVQPQWFGLGDRDVATHLVRTQMLQAGYAGEPIVIMDPTDQHLMHMMVLVFAQHLRDVGVTVDLQATDWGTLASRRPTKAPPSEDPSGYHVFPTWWPGFTMQNPITNIPLETTSGGKNWYGWPSDERLETLRVSYTGAQTEEERQKVVDAIQARFFEVVPYIYVGQFYRPVAYRKDRVTGVIGQQSPVFWNIDMTTA